jgi:hypothetical protein
MTLPLVSELLRFKYSYQKVPCLILISGSKAE